MPSSEPISHIWSSSRLIYRAPNAPETDSYFIALANDALSRTLSNTDIPKPPTRDRALKFRLDFYGPSALLGVVICLKPNNYDTDVTARHTSTWSETEPLTIIGNLDVCDAHGRHHRGADLGLNIIEGYRGQGYGSEAIEWALEWCFRHANLHRIHLQVYEFNYKARETYKRCGFQEEGAERDALWLDGRYWKLIHMGILEEEWRAGRNIVPGQLFLKTDDVAK